MCAHQQPAAGCVPGPALWQRANFTIGSCCRRAGRPRLTESGPGSAKDVESCADRCTSDLRCNHFSHSNHWAGCFTCAECMLENERSDTLYKTWSVARPMVCSPPATMLLTHSQSPPPLSVAPVAARPPAPPASAAPRPPTSPQPSQSPPPHEGPNVALCMAGAARMFAHPFVLTRFLCNYLTLMQRKVKSVQFFALLKTQDSDKLQNAGGGDHFRQHPAVSVHDLKNALRMPPIARILAEAAIMNGSDLLGIEIGRQRVSEYHPGNITSLQADSEWRRTKAPGCGFDADTRLTLAWASGLHWCKEA